MGVLPKVVEQENAMLPSSCNHFKITTKLLSNQPGALSEDSLNRTPITEDIKKPRGDWGREGSPQPEHQLQKRNPLNTWL